MRSIISRRFVTSILCVGSVALGWTAATMQAQSSDFEFIPTVSSSGSASDFESNAPEPQVVPENEQIDFDGFVLLASAERGERARRRVSVERFLAMSHEPNTIILDTRSKSAFDAAHLVGAVHLNFSDFTAEKLAAVIPGKQTRILIYCNNNFTAADAVVANTPFGTFDDSSTRLDEMGFASKYPVLALNIPTYINLRGYGYKDVYELADAVAINDTRIAFAGNAVDANSRQHVQTAF